MKKSRYADRTKVPIDRSKAEIERILTRYGADEVGYAIRRDKAAVIFSAHGKHLRFVLPLPAVADVAKTPAGRRRTVKSQAEFLALESKRRWRALALEIKAKLEAVETGIAIFEQEFLAQIVLPNGRTVAEEVLPRVEEIYRTGRVMGLLPESTEVV